VNFNLPTPRPAIFPWFNTSNSPNVSFQPPNPIDVNLRLNFKYRDSKKFPLLLKEGWPDRNGNQRIAKTGAGRGG
jgi:hypothetical protein